MISSTEAVNVLIAECKGTYTIRAHSTTVRTFKPSYDKDHAGFNYDKQLNDQPQMPYQPDDWINN